MSTDRYLDPLREAGFVAEFIPRIPGITGSYDKEEGLAALEPFHRQAVEKSGFRWDQLKRAEQVHGDRLEAVTTSSPAMISGVDGLLGAEPEVVLGIVVADCGLIWVADQVTGAVSLLHSGRKGTEAGILPQAIAAMSSQYGSRAQDLLVVLGPCIRPPLYEVDLASLIANQARDAGVAEFHDSGICTGADLEHHYSYRVEKGLTGRMLGLFAPRAASKTPSRS